MADSVKTALEKAYAEWGGKMMPDGANGCVEAAVRLGKYYSAFLENEYHNNTVNVSALMQNAQSAGIPVIGYTQANEAIGDVIVYTDTDDGEPAHVVISDGAGGYYGNSSRLMQIVHTDYLDLGSSRALSYLIKTGSGSTGLAAGGTPQLTNSKVTINIMGKTITFEPVLDWKSYAPLSNFDDGEAALNNLTQDTILGVCGTMGALLALGVHPELSSAWRSAETNAKYNGMENSHHLTGKAIDFDNEHASDEFWYQFTEEVSGKYWGYAEYHNAGSGMHLHMQDYIGGLTPENGNFRQVLQNGNGSGTGGSGGGFGSGLRYNFGGGSTPMEHYFVVSGHTTYLEPRNKTFCEPVYPDLIYLTGGVPSSVVGAAHEQQSSTTTNTTTQNSTTSSQDNADQLKASTTNTNTVTTQQTSTNSVQATTNQSNASTFTTGSSGFMADPTMDKTIQVNNTNVIIRT